MEMSIVYRSGLEETASAETAQAFIEAFYQYTGNPDVERIEMEFDSQHFVAFTHNDGMLRFLWPDGFTDAVEEALAVALDPDPEDESADVNEGVEGVQQTLPGIHEAVEVREHTTVTGAVRTRSLPAFLHREPVNTVEGFVWGQRSKLYLDHCRKECGLGRKQLLTICGFGHLNKLDKFRQQWHDLVRPIPRSYLQALQVDLGLLQDIVEVDRQEFAQTLALPRFPRSIVVKLLPTVYHNRPLPEGIAEEEAIEILQRTAHDERRVAWIHYPDLVTITAGRDGRVCWSEYWPELQVTPRWVSFGDRCIGLGTVSVGGRRF